MRKKDGKEFLIIILSIFGLILSGLTVAKIVIDNQRTDYINVGKNFWE